MRTEACQKTTAPNATDPPGLPCEDVEPLVRLAVQAGFSSLRHHPDGSTLMEKDGIRILLTPNGNGATVEARFPCQDRLIEFFLESESENLWWHSLRNGLIVRRAACPDVRTAGRALREVISHLPLIRKENGDDPVFGLLRPLGREPWLPVVPPPWVEKGVLLLRNTRALLVRGAGSDARAWLTAVVPSGHLFSFREEILVNAPEKAHCFLLNQSGALNHLAVLIDTRCLPNDPWKAAIGAAASHLASADTTSGARVLLIHTGEAKGYEGLPEVCLPDFGAAARRVSGIGSPVEAVLLRSPGDHDQYPGNLLQRAVRSTECGTEHGTTPVEGDDAAPVLRNRADLRRVRDLRSRLEAELARAVVGHHSILPEVCASIAFWAVSASRRPLVLAFAGPSGVGKNRICQVLASTFARPEFFDLPAPLHYSINLAVAQESKHWQLTGVGAGHVGAERRGLLETATGTDGYVLSFDEIDKQVGGTSDPQGFLVSILERNGFRNGRGNHVEFAKGLVVLTMNCGIDAASERLHSLGFGGSVRDPGTIAHHYRRHYERELIAPLRGRIHRAWFFGELEDHDRTLLARRDLQTLRMEARRLGLPWPRDWRGAAALAARIVAEADPALGARGIRQRIRHLRETLLHQARDDHARPPFQPEPERTKP